MYSLTYSNSLSHTLTHLLTQLLTKDAFNVASTDFDGDSECDISIRLDTYTHMYMYSLLPTTKHSLSQHSPIHSLTHSTTHPLPLLSLTCSWLLCFCSSCLFSSLLANPIATSFSTGSSGRGGPLHCRCSRPCTSCMYTTLH